MNKYIDHTLLKPWSTEKDIIQLCQEARDYKFRAVCVNPKYIELAVTELNGTKVLVASVIDFPLGCSFDKKDLAEDAIDLGAKELDVVWDLGDFKERHYLRIMNEIHNIVGLNDDIKIKVIVESCFLDENEQRKAYQIVQDSGAWCIKTSTGMFGGAEFETIKLWRSLGDLKIKASGGISSRSRAQCMLDYGADIIGTSHGVNIVLDQEPIQAVSIKDTSLEDIDDQAKF